MFKTELLKATDRCDRCGAQAYVLVELATGDLVFCGHHFAQYANGLGKVALAVVDNRAALLAVR